MWLCPRIASIKLSATRIFIVSLRWYLQVPGVSFPRLVQFLKFTEYRPYLLSGVVISVGGLADSLGKVSSQALFEFLQGVPPTGSGIGALTDPSSIWLGGQMLELLKNNRGIDRVIVPALKVQPFYLCLDAGVGKVLGSFQSI